MAHLQQQFLWAEEGDERGTSQTKDATPSPETSQTNGPPPPEALPAFDPIPFSRPLPEAVAAGVFGTSLDGPIEMDDEDIRVIIEEQCKELTAILADLQASEDGLRTGEDPRTGKQPRSPEAQARLRAYLQCEVPRLTTAYADTLAAFANGFGDSAAANLDLWVRKAVADCVNAPGCRYDPGHPWHYYHEGDNAPPIPVEDIEADVDIGKYIERELPKNRAKRAQRIREMLAAEQERVEEDKRRYQEIVERGAEALSRYDREIAHTSDAMARATALSLKYNHIRYGLGRVAWLKGRLSPSLRFDEEI